MDIDPLEAVENDEEEDAAEETKEKRKSRLNTWVAITVALLATFLGVCKVKDDNIVQAMQQAQADKIDNYAWYQARNIREEVLNATTAQLKAQALTAAPATRAVLEKEAARFQALTDEQKTKKKKQQDDADQAQKTYDRLNYHDDQFDLSDALLAIAISLLAMTSLTQKRWLFGVAMVPTFFGVLFGLAGLFNLSWHSDFFAKLLGT